MKHPEVRQKEKVGLVAILRSGDREGAFAALLDNVEDVELRTHVGTPDIVNGWRQNLQDADAIVVDVHPDNPDDMKLLTELVGTYGQQTTVVATASDTDLDDVRRLFRTGISDFLPQPFSPVDIQSILEQLRARRQKRARASATASRGGVISFIGGQGGEGTTTLAVQTAYALVEGQKLKGRNSVCLIDLDIQGGQASFALDLDRSRGLDVILDEPERLGASFLHDCMTVHRTGLDVLTAPSAILPLDALTPELVKLLIDTARGEYDVIVLDVPVTWTAWKHEALLQSDHIALVTQMLVPDLRMTRQQLDLIQDEGLGKIPLSVVVNRYAFWRRSVQVGKAEQALGRKIDFFVRNDFATVAKALGNGVPIFEVSRRRRMGKDVRKMSEALLEAIRGRAKPAQVRAE